MHSLRRRRGRAQLRVYRKELAGSSHLQYGLALLLGALGGVEAALEQRAELGDERRVRQPAGVARAPDGDEEAAAGSPKKLTLAQRTFSAVSAENEQGRAIETSHKADQKLQRTESEKARAQGLDWDRANIYSVTTLRNYFGAAGPSLIAVLSEWCVPELVTVPVGTLGSPAVLAVR